MQGFAVRVFSNVVLLAAGTASVVCLAVPAGAKGFRVRISPAAISHEHGACFIATLNFGEDGDKESGNHSGLLLFENGRPLGPAHALHRDIREKGRGRYSHWTRNSLYFSTSDNSDPTRNDRVYEVSTSTPDSTLGGLSRLADPPRKHVEVVRTPHHEYTIRMGGFLDAENTRTRSHGGIEIVFQPNLSLTLANTGEGTVRNPRLIANNRGDWGTLSRMVDEFTRGARTPQEKALFIWQAARENRYHCWPLFGDTEFHDPVKLFNCYGFALCDDAGNCSTVLWQAAGLGQPHASNPHVRGLHGHVQGEVMINGAWQFLDVDQDVFFLDRENRRPVSGDACAWDHDLVRREVCYGPVFGGWGSSDSNASLFGPDDTPGGMGVSGHTMDYSLRPGERVEFRWDNIGKWASQKEGFNKRPPFFGNSRFVYHPRLDSEHFREGVEKETDVVPGDLSGAALAGGSSKASLVYRIASPWVICGGSLSATFVGRGPEDRFALDILPEYKGAKPVRVWNGHGPGEIKADIAIDNALAPHEAPAKYGYRVIISLASAGKQHGAQLRDLEFITDVMTAPLSLPRLHAGENRFVFTADKARIPPEITVTHVWRECRKVQPPDPPEEALSPEPGSTTRKTFVPFRWSASKGCRTYHIQVSARRDFRVPWRPSYDVVVRGPQWQVPRRGMFSPDTPYYWRVRCRSARGVWSAWSPIWTFQWRGPCVPLQVCNEFTERGILLHWAPNPRGTRPVAYDVYGSDEKGFPVHREPYDAYVRGRTPGNLVMRTSATSLLVVCPKPTAPNQNRCYYRVVAVDAEGCESVSSAFVEMPHPHVWSEPPGQAVVGKPFRYQLRVVRSLGDVQHRYEQPNKVFSAEERLEYRMLEGPPWLAVDSGKGVLSGTPPGPGRFQVRLQVATQFGTVHEQAFELAVSPPDPPRAH